MKNFFRLRAIPAAAALVATTLFSGCVAYVEPYATTFTVPAPPPPVRYEPIPARPGPNYAWVPGYWNWYGSSYGWVSGRYAVRPHARAAYIAPRYVPYRGHYRYHHGYWR